MPKSGWTKYPREARKTIRELDINSYKETYKMYGNWVEISGKKTELSDNEQLVGSLSLKGFTDLKVLKCRDSEEN